MAEWTGLEPATLDVTGRYSNQLNYHSDREIDINDSFCLKVAFYSKKFFFANVAISSKFLTTFCDAGRAF